MSDTFTRTLPRLAPGDSAPVPGSHLPGHLRRMATLRRAYRKLGLIDRTPGAGGKGHGRPVRMGGRLYPSAQQAERSIGACRGAVVQAIRKGCRCHGLKVEWADVPRTKGDVDDDNS